VFARHAAGLQQAVAAHLFAKKRTSVQLVGSQCCHGFFGITATI
jgi:hypothetical protein